MINIIRTRYALLAGNPIGLGGPIPIRGAPLLDSRSPGGIVQSVGCAFQKLPMGDGGSHREDRATRDRIAYVHENLLESPGPLLQNLSGGRVEVYVDHHGVCRGACPRFEGGDPRRNPRQLGLKLRQRGIVVGCACRRFEGKRQDVVDLGRDSGREGVFSKDPKSGEPEAQLSDGPEQARDRLRMELDEDSPAGGLGCFR